MHRSAPLCGVRAADDDGRLLASPTPRPNKLSCIVVRPPDALLWLFCVVAALSASRGENLETCGGLLSSSSSSSLEEEGIQRGAAPTRARDVCEGGELLRGGAEGIMRGQEGSGGGRGGESKEGLGGERGALRDGGARGDKREGESERRARWPPCVNSC